MANTRRAVITNHGRRGTVVVDGVRIPGVRHVTVSDGAADSLPTLTVEIVVHEVAFRAGLLDEKPNAYGKGEYFPETDTWEWYDLPQKGDFWAQEEQGVDAVQDGVR